MTDQIPQQQYTSIPTQPKDSTLALLSLIFGIGAYFILPFLGAIAAIVLGHLGKSEIKKSAGMLKGNGMATWGLVLGYIQIGLFVLSLCAILVLLPIMGSSIAEIFSDINSSMY
ncbi:MAG: DUF4190 domain-containing protein [Anaerolineaceae bacterium]|jgi:hypothetical protein|nr:DUF4190 domain-containing protein [Anaerolineaceae bacterium]